MGKLLRDILSCDNFAHDHDLTTLPRCHKGVWQSQDAYHLIFSSTAFNDDTELKERAIERFNETVQRELERDRDEDCYFYPIRQSMSLDAAEELEKRAADRREAERDRELTRKEGRENRHRTDCFIVVTIIALVVSTLTAAISVGVNWYFQGKKDRNDIQNQQKILDYQHQVNTENLEVARKAAGIEEPEQDEDATVPDDQAGATPEADAPAAP